MSATAQKEKLIHVTVHYVAAEKPFKKDADRNETVGQLKTEALKAFGLTEGPGPDGTTITYTLYHDKSPLENLNETLGAVAGVREALELKLVQQITQGRGCFRLEPIRNEP